ncbi:flavodoxin [Eisenbergiella sp.]
MSKALVAYFSASGVTANLAEKLAEITGSDLFEITPKIPYTSADLNWMDNNARSTIEMHDRTFRPEIAALVENMEQYGTIYLGFPIWWYVAPTIINTFLESYDLSNKRIVLFATSGGSGFGRTVEGLKGSAAADTVIEEGKVFGGRTSTEELKKWVESV